MRNPLNLLGRSRIHAARKLTVVWGGHNYSARLHDAHGANSTALLVEFLLNRNFEFHRSRITVAQKISRPVVNVNTDTFRGCTVVFGSGGAVIYSQLVDQPAVMITASIDQILNLSQIRVKARGVIHVGLLSTPGRRFVRDLRTRKMVVNGVFRHPVTALRLLVLLSTASA